MKYWKAHYRDEFHDEDILIANQIADPAKIRRGASLAGDCRLTVLADCAANVDAWAKAAAV